MSGSDDWSVRAWDVATGEQFGLPVIGHGGGISSVAVTADGQQIASWSAYGALALQLRPNVVRQTDGQYEQTAMGATDFTRHCLGRSVSGVAGCIRLAAKAAVSPGRLS